MHLQNLLTAQGLAAGDVEKIAICVRPTGLHLQKARRLKAICSQIMIQFGEEANFCSSATRPQLLMMDGIGGGTADRIFLYSCARLAWPVDTYCLRVFTHYGLLKTFPQTSTERRKCTSDIQQMVTEAIPHNLEDWQGLQALMQIEGEQLRL